MPYLCAFLFIAPDDGIVKGGMLFLFDNISFYVDVVNYCTGPIPDELGQLTSLVEMIFWHNKLEGENKTHGKLINQNIQLSSARVFCAECWGKHVSVQT